MEKSLSTEMEHLISSDPEKPCVPIYEKKMRWFYLAIMCELSFTNALGWLNFASVVNQAMEYYHIGTDKIDALSLMYMVCSFLLMFPAMWLLDRRPFSISILIVGIMQGMGGIFRLIGTYVTFNSTFSLFFVFLGQFCIAFCASFVVLMATKQPTLSFNRNQQTFAINAVTICNFMGMLFATGVIPFFGTKADRIPLVMAISGVPCILGLVLCPFIFCDAKFRIAEELENDESFFAHIKMLMKKFSFVFLSFGFGISIGIMGSVITFLSQVSALMGFSQLENIYVSYAFFGFGLISSFVVSWVADKYRVEQFLLKMFQCMSSLATIILFMCHHIGIPLYGYIILVSIVGIFSIPLTALYQMVGVDITKPIPSATGSGVQWFLSQILGSSFGFIMVKLIEFDNEMGSPFYALLAIAIINSMATVCLFIGFVNKN